jgi:tetratricopeptide (TPR) repeat protein
VIGRERERDVVRRAVARAAADRSAFLLVVGEPGIGKTTLLGELSDLAANAGLTVGCGRGVPEGAAPLWPWTSALANTETKRSGPTLDSGASRFAVFERLAGDLGRRAAERPMALVIDDLQWADLSALRFLAHLLDRPALAGVLVAAGLRTTEPLADEAADVVSGLLAHPSAGVVELSSFGEAEVTAFADERLARRPSDDEVALLVRRSGGNPFLLGELLRWMPAADSPVELDAVLPLAVRESVRRRLVVEDGTTQMVVKAAAVAGSAATLKLLATVTGVDGVEVGRALDSAERAGIVVVEPGRRGSVTFVHDLVRQVVMSLLPTWSRIELHHAVGMALHDDVRSSSWAVVAAHLVLARPLVDDVTLSDVLHRAANEASRAGAFDEAADHLAVALELTAPAGDTAERGELLLERGRALWAAERADESTAVLGEAAALARRTGNGELLARVALSWRGGELRMINRRADDQFLALLREALAAYPPGDSQLRCLLLSRLARCAHFDLGDRDGIAAGDEAVAIARRLGDPEALTESLGTRFYYCWRPELVRERLVVADEIIAVATAADDAGLVAQGSYFRLHALLELGWLRDAWSELDRFEAAVAASGQPIMKVRALWLRATRHLALGERQQADEAADEACQLAERMGRPDAAVERLGQSILLWAAEDRVDDVMRMVGPVLRHPVTYNSVVAMANGFGGRPVEARAALGAVVAAGLERHPRDMMWIFGRCGLLAAAVVSGDRDAGQVLHDSLVPFAGQWAVLNPGIVVAGAVDHYLGLGAALLGRTDEAVDHLRRAAATHERQGAVALALLSLHELGTVLERRGQTGDDDEIARIEQRIALLDTRNTVPFKPLLHIMWSAPDAAPVPQQLQRLVLEGDTWLVEFAGARARLRDQRGLHHLRTLLERPGTEVPALTLAGSESTLAGSNEHTILDQRAMREYRQRITDLQVDIDEATTNNDIERTARAESELDALVEQLALATGFGGRSRQFNGADERARVSVTKAIRSAIHHLRVELPELERHLTATVRTGSRCIYQPDPRAPQRWTTERL